MKRLATLNNIFLFVIFCLPLYIFKVTIFGVPSNVLELLALLAIVLALIKKKRLLLNSFLALPKFLIFCSALIVSGLLISTFFNDNILAGFGIIKGWFIIPMFFSLALYSILDSKKSMEKIFASIYFSTIVVGLVALSYKISGIATYDNRLSAFYLSPNYLAMYLSPGVFFGLYFLWIEYSETNFSKKTIAHIFLLSMILLPLYFTYSYGAWIAIIISLSLLNMVFISKKKQLLIFFSIIFVCGSLLFISQQNSQKVGTLFFSRSSMASRLMIWHVSLRLIVDNPIIGIGPGNFQDSYLALQKYYPPYLEWAVPEPHNIFLAFWLQAGLLGIVGFLGLLSFIFKSLWKIIKNKKNTALAAPLLGFFLYTILHGLIDTTYWKNDLAFLFWICIFLLIFIEIKINYIRIQPLVPRLHEHD